MGFWGSVGDTLGDIGVSAVTLNPGYHWQKKANEEQAAAAKDALNRQLSESDRVAAENIAARQQAQELLAGQGLEGLSHLKDYTGQAQGQIDQATQNSLNALIGGQQDAEQAYRGYTDSASNYLGQGQGAAMNALGQGYAQGANALMGSQGGYEQAINEGLGGTLGEIGQGLADSRLAGLYQTSYTPSADYGFRQQQGEQALNMAAAARGGRGGGAQLQKLADFNQGLASEDYGNWANQQQAIASSLDAQQMNAANQAAQALYGAGSNIAGNRQSTASQLGGLQTNYGNQAGDIAYNAGLQQSALQSGLGSNLAGLYSSTAGNAANIYNQGAAQNSSLLSGLGANLGNAYQSNAAGQANLLTGAAAQNANLTQAALPYYQVPTQFAGAGNATTSQALGQGASNAAMLAGLLYSGKL